MMDRMVKGSKVPHCGSSANVANIPSPTNAKRVQSSSRGSVERVRQPCNRGSLQNASRLEDGRLVGDSCDFDREPPLPSMVKLHSLQEYNRYFLYPTKLKSISGTRENK